MPTYRSRMGKRWGAALAGVLAALAGLAVGQFVAALGDSAYAPIQVVGASATDLAPIALKEWATSTFGTASKTVVVIVVAIAVLAVAVVAGLAARRRPIVGVALCLGVGLVGALAGLRRPTMDPFAPVPSLVAGIVAAGALLLMINALRAPGPSATGTVAAAADDTSTDEASPASTPNPDVVTSQATPGPTRRAFLARAGIVSAVGLAALAGAQALGSRAKETTARIVAALPKAASPLPPLPASVNAPVTGIAPFVTPNVNFYRIDTAFTVPNVDAATWSLRFAGLVRRPFTITYAELLDMPMVERDITLMCVSNPIGGGYIGNARWLGTPLMPLLERAGIDAGADQLFSTSVDGWTCSTPLSDLADRDPIFAIGMNGEPLPADHGYPVRMVIPGLYGFISATKWVTSIEAATYAQMPAYWTVRGWATDAPVLTGSRIDQPNDVARPGPQPIAGVAWAMDGNGISQVQVKVDDGEWIEANLADVPATTTWRQWWLEYDLSPGLHAITVRARNGLGEWQSPDLRDVIPSGATGYHNRVVDCVGA